MEAFLQTSFKLNMRNGKARKEIYFDSKEQIMLSDACRLTGLDKTNTLRLMINLGFRCLNSIPDTADCNAGIKMKSGTKRMLTGNKAAI